MKENYLFVFSIFMALFLSQKSWALIEADEYNFDCGIEPIEISHGNVYAIKKVGNCVDQRSLAAPKFSVRTGCESLQPGELCIRASIYPLNTFNWFNRNYSYKYKISTPAVNGMHELAIYFKPGPGHCDLEEGTTENNDCGFFGTPD